MHSATPLKGVGAVKRPFRRSFSWQAQYLVNLGDVVKGSKASFCEAVVVFDLVRQVVVLGAVLRMRFELSLSRCARSAW